MVGCSGWWRDGTCPVRKRVGRVSKLANIPVRYKAGPAKSWASLFTPDICQLYLGSDHDGKISTISLPAGTGAVWSRGRPGDGQDGPWDGGRYWGRADRAQSRGRKGALYLADPDQHQNEPGHGYRHLNRDGLLLQLGQFRHHYNHHNYYYYHHSYHHHYYNSRIFGSTKTNGPYE